MTSLQGPEQGPRVWPPPPGKPRKMEFQAKPVPETPPPWPLSTLCPPLLTTYSRPPPRSQEPTPSFLNSLAPSSLPLLSYTVCSPPYHNQACIWLQHSLTYHARSSFFPSILSVGSRSLPERLFSRSIPLRITTNTSGHPPFKQLSSQLLPFHPCFDLPHSSTIDHMSVWLCMSNSPILRTDLFLRLTPLTATVFLFLSFPANNRYVTKTPTLTRWS